MPVSMLLALGLWMAPEAAMPARGLCAHRGAAHTHPENTLAAFREAVRAGAHMIELDVYLSRDGYPVVMHDPTVNRTTNGAGRIADLTLAEIKRLDAGIRKAPEFAGERVPTFQEALAVMPRNVWLNVHLKEDVELARVVAGVLAKENRLHQAFLACGRQAAEAAQRVEPRILICNMERQGGGAAYVEGTIARRTAFIQLLTRQYSADWVPRLKEAGVRVNYCCTDDPAQLRALFAAGVDFPLVDHIQAAMKVAREAGIEPLRPVFKGQ